MKTNHPFLAWPRSRARFTSLHALAAAGLLLGGLGTAATRADILYVTQGNGTIEKITAAGAGSVFGSIGTGNPDGLAFDSARNLYAADFSNNTIEKFTPGGVGAVFANSGLSNPAGLAFDSAGNLFVANFNNSTIEKFTPGGVGSVFASSGVSKPLGLAFDKAGNLYAGNNLNNTIEKFTPGGSGSVFANMNKPQGLAFDSAGNLYAADSGNSTIEKFSSTGTDLGAFATSANGLSFPAFLAFTTDAGVPLALPPLPEPATCALLLLGGLGMLAARRPREGRQHRA